MRLKSLDGLRGTAAAVVLLYHSAFVFLPPQTTHYIGQFWLDLFAFSPLRMPFLGAEAVHLFFVLSGFTLPMIAEKTSLKSRRYYLSRFVRLYAPVWAALATLVFSIWIKGSCIKLEVPELNKEFWLAWTQDALLFPGNTHVIGALWSLTWEVLFSFSLIFWVKVVKEKWPLLQLSAMIILMYVGDFLNSGVVLYLPMFIFGTVLWKNKVRFQYFVQKISASRSRQKFILILSSLTVPYIVMPLFKGVPFELIKSWFYVSEFAAIALLLGWALWVDKVSKTLSSKFAVKLGTISYSLYLVHQIVLDFVAPLPLVAGHIFLLSVGGSLVFALFFYHLVEKHVHSYARGIMSKSP